MRRVLGISLLTCCLLIPTLARGQMTGNVEKLKADLYGEDTDKAVAAASALGSLKKREAIDALMASLQLGMPPKVIGAVIEAVELQKDPESIPLLEQYAEYRDPEIRGAAIKALGAIEDPKTVDPLISALGDSNPMVRARAARVLGERNEKKAAGPLFMMLKRGDVSAAKPLGIVGDVESARELSELIGDMPGSVLASALGTMLLRPDLGPDPIRQQIVSALGRIPGDVSTGALAEYVAKFPAEKAGVSKDMAKKIINDREGQK